MRFPAAVLLCLLAVAAPAVAATKPKPKPHPIVLGIAEQNSYVFDSPLFAPLGLKQARTVVPWDAVLKNQTEKFDAWLAGARANGVEPLVSFTAAEGSRCPDKPCHLPTEREFTQALRAFLQRYPDVRQMNPWNEANHKTQPTYHDPLMAAQYYKVMKRLCKGCTVVAADVLDDGNMRWWLTEFRQLAPGARLWGLHNYGDTNRFRTKGAEMMLKTVPGTVWLTETGAIVSFTTAKGVKALPRSEKRAARSMNYLFDTLVPSSKRIKRVYVYNWLSDPSNRWDSGLVRADGTPRKTYDIVKRHAALHRR